MSLAFDIFIVYIYISIILCIVRIVLGIYRSARCDASCVYNKEDVAPKSIFMFIYIAPQWVRLKFWRGWKDGEWEC